MHRPRKFRTRVHLPTSEEVRPAGGKASEVSAVEDLRYIRQTMERSSAFTAVPGWGMAGIGCTALLAAGFASRHLFDLRWLEIWITEAVLAISIAVVAIQRKAVVGGLPWTSGPGRKVALSFAPAVAAAALLTIPLMSAGQGAVLPGAWLLLYGVGVIAGGAYSVAVVPVMGVCFMGAGAGALLALHFVPALSLGLGNGAMAAGFGGLHILFGIWIARRHGG